MRSIRNNVIPVVAFLASTAVCAFALTYYDKQSSAWDNTATWETTDGGGVNVGTYPTNGETAVIDAFTVSITQDGFPTPAQSLLNGVTAELKTGGTLSTLDNGHPDNGEFDGQDITPSNGGGGANIMTAVFGTWTMSANGSLTIGSRGFVQTGAITGSGNLDIDAADTSRRFYATENTPSYTGIMSLTANARVDVAGSKTLTVGGLYINGTKYAIGTYRASAGSPGSDPILPQFSGNGLVEVTGLGYPRGVMVLFR